jgi:hypothetical protein
MYKILTVPISPKINIAQNYFVGVMNDVIVKIELLKFFFYLTNFGEVLNSMNFGDSIHSKQL